MDSTMMKIKEQCETELIQYANKAGWSASMAETVCNLVTAIEKICKMEQMERTKMPMVSGDGYSGAGTWIARGDYGPSMQQPMSRGMFGGGYSGDGSSYRPTEYSNAPSGTHWVDGHYSRDGSKDALIRQLDEQIQMARDPQERERLMQAKQALMH